MVTYDIAAVRNGTSPTTIDPIASRKISQLYFGYMLLAASFMLYVICEYGGMRDNFFMAFCVHYFIAIAYTVSLMMSDSFGVRKSWRRENMSLTVVLVNLYFISAYALNRELVVFADSTDWLCFYILLTSAAILSFNYFDKLPKWMNKVQLFFVGCAAIFYLYLALYVANFYLIGGIGLLALGIGGHIFVPLILFASSLVLFARHCQAPRSVYWFAAGIILPLVVLAAFTFTWQKRIEGMEKEANQSVMYNENAWPVWTRIAQRIPNDWLTERILKEDLVYVTANKDFGDWTFMPGGVSWEEVKKHDPLVFISSLIKRTSLSQEDRVKIIQAISDGRHKANERLWSGDNLSTSYIVTDVDIFPDLRLAYTEKYLNVRNNSSDGSWWGNTEEGIYTFYLPEGSVVTSLSLWIDGAEQKGILTSKQKATNAYNTIVGGERRDPSVVHWQEGNTVTVRVFPCTKSEERKFKIGITSPLQAKNGRVYYKSISFKGPNPNDALETTRVRFIGKAPDLSLDDGYEKKSNGDYIREHNYDPALSISFALLPVKENSFTFNGYTYSIADHQLVSVPQSFKTILLDINNTWKESDLNALRDLLLDYKMATYIGENLVTLDRNNWVATVAEAREQNFSLFPFHKVIGDEQTLVITKGQVYSPHLRDLNGSVFANDVTAAFAGEKKINVFNLDGEVSTYVNSLKEFRAFEFAAGNVNDLQKLLAMKQFPKIIENEDQVVLPGVSLVIKRTQASKNPPVDTAPDHLARLFAYNDIMRKVGTTYFSKDYVNEDLVDEAASAYVVSPVSSLIVLETQEDYKRFDINDKDDSLKNASKQSSGAVPEPHEWALIILFGLLAIYLKYKL